MAKRIRTYPNVTRGQLLHIQRALAEAGIPVHPVALAEPHSQSFDAGIFHTRGYEVNYSFFLDDPSESTGTLTVQMSGPLLFIGIAMRKLDDSIQPHLTKG